MLALKMRPLIQTAISSELKEVVSRTANSKHQISSISSSTELTDSQLESTENHFYVDNIKVYGKVELTSKNELSITLTQKESQEINLDLSSHYGPIYQLSRDESQPSPKRIKQPLQN